MASILPYWAITEVMCVNCSCSNISNNRNTSKIFILCVTGLMCTVLYVLYLQYIDTVG